MNSNLWIRIAAALGVGFASPGCVEEEPASAYARGEKIYRNVCITCHAPDPSEPGSAGPAIAGSSRELIEARVMRGAYPPGYEPKRSSRLMPRFPHLEDSIDDLTAYLAEAGS